MKVISDRRYRRWICGLALGALTAFAVALVAPQPAGAAEPFFKGKTIRIIVGLAAGGGFDAYSRLFARYLGKYIPGNPTVIVQNMTGAGSLIAANYVYKAAKPDGLTIGHWNANLILSQLFAKPGVEFDARKFEWIGSPMDMVAVIAFRKESGITSAEKWRSAGKPPTIGATAPGNTLYDIPKIVVDTFGFPAKVIAGYAGFSEMRLALEGGEIDGLAPSWQGAKATWANAFKKGDVVMIMQSGVKPHPDLPHIPLVMDFAKTKEQKDLMRAGFINTSAVNRAYSLPPGTPKDRVEILSQAFDKTVKDPEFLKDALKSDLEITPLTGQETKQIVSELFDVSPNTLNKLKTMIQ